MSRIFLIVTSLAICIRVSLSLSLSELAGSKSTLSRHDGTSTVGNIRTELPQSNFDSFHRGLYINRSPDAFFDAACYLVYPLSHLIQGLTGFVVVFFILLLLPHLTLSMDLQFLVVAIIDVTRDCSKRLRYLMEMFLQSVKAVGSGDLGEGTLGRGG